MARLVTFLTIGSVVAATMVTEQVTLWWLVRTLVGAWLVTTIARQLYMRFIVFGRWPSPSWTWPLIGNAIELAPALLRYLMRLAKRQRGEGLFLFWPGGSDPVACIANARAAKEVLGSTSGFPKSPDYETVFGFVFGDGLVTSTGPTHARARRILGRFFVRSTLEKEAGRISTLVDTYLDEALKTVRDNEPVDVQDLFHFATLQIFTLTMLGVDFFLFGTRRCPILGSKDDDDEGRKRVRKVLYGFVQKLKGADGRMNKVPTRDAALFEDDDYYLAPGEALSLISGEVAHGSNVIGYHMVYGIPMTPLFPHVRKLGLTMRESHQFFQVIIDARRSAMQNQDDVPDDCLTALVHAADNGDDSGLPKLTDEQVLHQIVTLISAGHDTTAFMCCYAVYELAKHPDIQDALRRELSNDDFHFPTSLLKRVLQETLRLYPTIPAVTRVAAKDIRLPRFGDPSNDAKLRVAKGTKVMVPFFILNRQPGVWGNDADDFRPDRWIDINGPQPSDGLMHPKLGFIPFAYGSRTCIGYNLSLVEGKLLLQRLLQKYTVLPVPNFKPRIQAGITLTVENPHGIKVQFKHRA